MFGSLSDKLTASLRKMRGYGTMTEENLKEALRDVRMALLEADVNFKVVKRFVADVKEQALGQEVHKKLNPGQQFIQIVHNELVTIMGGRAVGLDLTGQPPTVIMVAGLQGSGKTTTVGKLARKLLEDRKKPMVVAADIYRPAAIDQLETLARQVGIPIHLERDNRDAVAICKTAYQKALEKDVDVLLLDTAGRLHIDEEMMDELVRVREAVRPREVLLVLDSMTGQDAVRVATEFDGRLQVSGVILTKLDGDARGGAALSVRMVTGRPIKFVGVGEKLDALQTFHPERMASRILDMGDVLSLVEQAQKEIDESEMRQMSSRMFSGDFNLEDFLSQLETIGKLGPIGDLMKMIPGFGQMSKMADMQVDEKQFAQTKAIIQSMTRVERRKPDILDGSRRKRIATGSGTTVQDVNQLMKQFGQARGMMKQMKKMMGMDASGGPGGKGKGKGKKKGKKKRKGKLLRMPRFGLPV